MLTLVLNLSLFLNDKALVISFDHIRRLPKKFLKIENLIIESLFIVH